MRRAGLFLVLAIGIGVALAVSRHSHNSLERAASTNIVVEHPNLLFITIDTLRPDHLGAYGYKKIETPTIDGLAKNGILFRQAVCQTPLTLVSHSSIFTGLNPNVHGVRDNAYFTLSSRFTTLAEYLKQIGYTTAAFIGSAILDRRYGLAQGFDWYSRYQPTEIIGMESQRRAEEVISEALSWLQKSETSSKPYFLWIHLYDAHAPYDSPEPFRTQYSTLPYDGEIAYTDHVLGFFLDQLQKLGFLHNAVIVVMGDHGESLGEHRETDHGFFIYDATVRIPLILYWSGHLKPAIVEQEVQSIDVLPTLAQLLNFKTDGLVQGKSMTALLKGEPVERPPAYGESMTPKLYYGWSDLKSIRTTDWKYIEAPQPELYNLKEDPGELNNAIQQHPDKARQMREQLKKIIQMEQTANPPKQASVDAERLEQLASLGYIGAANPGAMLNRSSNIDPKTKIEDYLLLHKTVPEAVDYIDHADYQTALRRLKTVEGHFTNSFVIYWYMGLCYAKLGDIARAREAYSHAIELNPYFGRAYTDLASTLELQGHHEEAMKLLDGIPPSAISTADRMYARGEIEMHQEKFQDAENDYQRALQADPDNSETQYALARLYLATGRIDQAVASMEELVVAHYPSQDVYYSLSAIYQKEGDSLKAEKILQQWVELFPRSASACYRYGLFLAQRGDRQQAISYLEKAVQIDPSLQEAAKALAAIRSG